MFIRAVVPRLATLLVLAATTLAKVNYEDCVLTDSQSATMADAASQLLGCLSQNWQALWNNLSTNCQAVPVYKQLQDEFISGSDKACQSNADVVDHFRRILDLWGVTLSCQRQNVTRAVMIAVLVIAICVPISFYVVVYFYQTRTKPERHQKKPGAQSETKPLLFKAKRDEHVADVLRNGGKIIEPESFRRSASSGSIKSTLSLPPMFVDHSDPKKLRPTWSKSPMPSPKAPVTPSTSQPSSPRKTSARSTISGSESVPNTMSGDSDVRPTRSHAAAPTTLTNLTEEDAGAEVDVPRRPIFVRQLTLHEQEVHRHDSTSDEAPAERWNYSINDDRGDDPDMEDEDDDLVVLRHLSARDSSQA
ncbi:uncharacterized protein MONBRDRAFT_32641 [Monosiga brevicollis MX1]|uniref:Uncharacterized protein n=1 Tax=Monosiga brevicollis TaxID=81824 RepID=A9V0V3_MONBE|nr:uncharacterized protein MONBRDRAFT_32641 [Monosiga brevicollis MX1]EDQ88819.1 predicted protein [Monosiga brevicollis MX1]|eukprot:XP_001746432.1 hypothetical protein [Monosiga brevicollis MX1]